MTPISRTALPHVMSIHEAANKTLEIPLKYWLSLGHEIKVMQCNTLLQCITLQGEVLQFSQSYR